MNKPSNKKLHGVGTIAKQLRKLEELKKKGILAKDEYSKKKERLLKLLHAS